MSAIPAGYKQTEVGVIPEDWHAVRLAEISRMKSGKGITSEFIDAYSDFPCYGGNGIRGFTSRFTHDGCFALIGRQGALCGNVLYVEGKFFASEHAIVTTPLAKTDISWLSFVLRDMNLNQYSESSAQPGLSVEKLLELYVPYPPVREQEAIAEVLCDADAHIESLEQQLTKKRHLKQAAMQELLSGKKRLSGFVEAWAVKQLGDIASVTKGSQLHSSEVSLSDTYPHLNGGVNPSGRAEKANTPAESIAISEGGNSCGYVQFMEEPYWAGGHCYSVVPSRIEKKFLYHALKFQQSSIMGLRVGSGLPNVQKSALLTFSLRIPQQETEQVAIAAILSAMDVEISDLEAQLAKTRTIKQGMMQKLLTGEIRLI